MTAMTDRSASPDSAHIPDAAELVARVRELQPLLRKNAAQGEQDRRVVEESIQALRDAGVFKIAQPRRYGGYETSMRTMLDVSAAIGAADGGTAWVATLLNVCAWTTSLFPQRAQDDVWGANPDALVSGVLTPTSETRKVDGGHRVTGRWYYNSGSWHADWATVGIPITDANGEVVDQGSALIPSSELEIEDTWFVAGMKSTGSNCLIAKDVFVPEHRPHRQGDQRPALRARCRQLRRRQPDATHLARLLGRRQARRGTTRRRLRGVRQGTARPC